MSADDHKAIVRRWIEAYNDRDEQAEADARTPDYVAHAPGLPGPLNSEGWTQFIATFSEAFPDIRLTVEDILAEVHGRCRPSSPTPSAPLAPRPTAVAVRAGQARASVPPPCHPRFGRG